LSCVRATAPLFGPAIDIVRDGALAEDAVQEAFIRITRHAERIDAQLGSVATWTSTITRNLSIDARCVNQLYDQVFLQLMSTERGPEDLASPKTLSMLFAPLA
jgi:DNA-directed RNA polymerase specialized sigma24 family protein